MVWRCSTVVNVENIDGTDNADIITGSTVSNTILGQDGVDTISGNRDDYICGGVADTLFGDAGDDKLYGK